MVPSGGLACYVVVPSVTTRNVEVGACGSCMDGRGYTDADLADGICGSSMPQLTEWTIWADKVITF